MKKRNIVILGGSGFIGTRLTRRLLNAGHQVELADIQPSAAYPQLWRACNITCLDQVVQTCRGADLVYNLAAVHRDDVRPRDLYYQVNVEGARVLCRAMADLGLNRLIFTSSVAIYGMPEGELGESGTPRPFNDYGHSKLEAEKVYLDWVGASSERSLVVVRPTVVFGEGNRGNVYNLLRQIVSGRFVMIGNGRNRKSVAYVENVAAFLEFLIEKPTHHAVYNYVDKPDLDMNTLVRLIKARMGQPWNSRVRLPYWLGYSAGLCFDLAARCLHRPLPISSVRIMKFCGNSVFSAERARATGFMPPVALQKAIDQVIDYEFKPRPAVQA